MKKLYIFFAFLLSALSGQSQEVWGPPYPLTDSLTNNVNATLSIVPGEFIQPDTLYLLWERSLDQHSTGIYARNLTTMSNPFLVAGQANAHFGHPRVFRRGTGDTLFYFSYETDMNGNWDLYYSVLMKNETVLGPFPFIQTSLNERSLNFGDSQDFSWERDGKILFKGASTDTVILASDSCSNPVEGNDYYVGYKMALGADTGVFYSKCDPVTHIWSSPLPLDVTGINTHLTFGNDSYGDEYSGYVFWQNKTGPYWVVKGFDLSQLQFYTFNNYTNSNNVSPSFCNIILFTDQDIPTNINFFTFASDITGNMEVYVNSWLYDTTYLNLSEYSGTDTHPQLFNNFIHYGMGLDNQLFDIWESYRGGHWQLWASNLDVLTGEKILTDFTAGMIRCRPNPFTKETLIEYVTGGDGSQVVDIVTISGKNIRTLTGTEESPGKYRVTWDGKDDNGVPVPAGTYLCTVKTGDKVLNYKIIRQ
jgi:hypothetical protein